MTAEEKNALLVEAMAALHVLFTNIRNDFSDPRGWCRQGWAICNAAKDGEWEKLRQLVGEVEAADGDDW